MTQEHLAELLAISPQAISRWETDSAMPDISLLPPLANLFNVTTDYLLGMDTYQKDLRKAEFDEAFHEYWKHDDKEKNYQIAVRAATEYPGNMEYVEWLASAEYYVAFLYDDEEYKKLLNSSVSHYRIVIENTNDHRLKNKALYGIVLSLSAIGEKAEAKDYAKLVDDKEKQDELLCRCLEGNERMKHCQEVAERKLNTFLSHFTLATTSVEAHDAVEKILGIVFPDGNYQYYHDTLQFNNIYKASVCANNKQFDFAIEALSKARYHALKMDEYRKDKCYQFTGPFFNLVCGENPESETEETNFDSYILSLNRIDAFDPLREREDFKSLLMQ